MEKEQELDLENWMANLPQQLRATPIIHLAIPGSHDSMTSSITVHSKLAPDAEVVLQRLRFLGPLLRYTMSRWSKTQDYDVVEQLKAGIRYFDLRVATRKRSVYPYIVHGLYATDVVGIINHVEEFLNAHPNELIIVYRSENARFKQPLLWASASFPSPWPETVSKSELVTKLDEGISKRPNDTAFVSQCVLTPTNCFVTKHLFSTLRKQCAIPLEKVKLEWLEKQKAGRSGVNIVISDFIDMSNSQFAKAVIALNTKSLKEDSIEPALTPVEVVS